MINKVDGFCYGEEVRGPVFVDKLCCVQIPAQGK